jgi:hypothetical protein
MDPTQSIGFSHLWKRPQDGRVTRRSPHMSATESLRATREYFGGVNGVHTRWSKFAEKATEFFSIA